MGLLSDGLGSCVGEESTSTGAQVRGTDPDYQDELLPLLQSRNKKIVDGFEIEGVRMERVKKLVIPLGEFGSKKLRRCQ